MRFTPSVAAVAGVVAAVFIACSSGPTSTPGDGTVQPGKTASVATVEIGKPIDIKDFSSEYTVTVAGLKLGQKSGNQFTQPAQGHQFIVFEVTFAVTKGQILASPSDFKLQTATGEVFSWALAVIDDVDQGWTTTLSAGQNKSGKVVLEVPSNLTGAKIFVTHGIGSDPAGFWPIPAS